jgi:hypothetical protein
VHVLVRVVVLACAVMDLTAWMAALHLDRGVADGKPIAKPLLEIADDVLGVAERAVANHHVTAERHLI